MALTKKLLTAQQLHDLRIKRLEVFPTGILSLDMALGQEDPKRKGRFGIPSRTIMEAFGTHMTGKTLLAERLVASVLDADPTYEVVYIMTEEPNTERLIELGLDMDRINIWSFMRTDEEIKKTPEGFVTAEEGLDIALEYIQKTKTVKLVVIDTVKACVAETNLYEKDKKTTKSTSDSNVPAALATLMQKFILGWLAMNNSDAILLMLNQISESIGNDFVIGGNFKIKTPGGRFKEQQSMIRIKCDSTKIEENKEDAYSDIKNQNGLELYYTVIKNKYCEGSLNRRAKVNFMFDPPRLDLETTVLGLGQYLGLVQVAGGGWTTLGKDEVGKEIKVQGFDKAAAYLIENPDIRKNLEEEIKANHHRLYKTEVKSVKPSVEESLNAKKK